MTLIIVLAVVAAASAAGWLRERRRHNASIRTFGRALADTTRCLDSHGLLAEAGGNQS